MQRKARKNSRKNSYTSNTSYKPKGIAARAGHWSATHRKTAIFGWLAFMMIALFIGQTIGSRQLTDTENTVGESGRAEQALNKAFDDPAAEMVLIQAKRGGNANDPGFKAAVADVTARLSKQKDIQKVQSPYTHGMISKDQRSALVISEVKGDPETVATRVAPIVADIKAAQKAHPELRIESFGASAEKELDDVFMGDLKKAGMLSLPVTLIILLIVFGSLTAAGVPLLLALSAVVSTMGLIAIPSQIFPIDEGASEVILLIGLAVGVDYSLFYMRREREERAAGRSPQAALQRASETSGRAVLVSGLTVMTAMAGMFLAGDKGFVGLGLGAMMVVAVAMVGSLTVLPAMIAWLGNRPEKTRKRRFGRPRSSVGESRIWSAVIDRVLRRPVVSAVVATTALVILAIPALGMKTTVMGAADMPQDLPAMKTYNKIEKAFPGENNQAVVVVEDDNVRTGATAAAIGDLKREAVATGQMRGPIDTEYSKDGTVAQIAIPMDGNGNDAASKTALSTLRGEVVPATVGDIATVNVTGPTAETVDQRNQLTHAMPIVFGFVLTLAFGLLLVTFRSIVVPIKAIALNLLSIGAAYGVLVWVFQQGHLEGLLNFQSNGGVATWLPLFMFVVLFGLSMDYHVFILSRVREAVDRGMNTDDAVSYGIKSTAGVVTSAAFVMVAVFAVFATLQVIDFKELGVGLAVAIAIDATIVRAVLLPASMKLLGDRNWYLPNWLQWLPQTHTESSPTPASTPKTRSPRPTGEPEPAQA